jgi:hypothetical protein
MRRISRRSRLPPIAPPAPPLFFLLPVLTCGCFSWPAAGSRTSWNYDLNSYEAKRLLNLIEEPSSSEHGAYEEDSAVSESKFTVVSEVTWKSSHPTQPPSTTISRANSDLSSYVPVRRRSVIQTPGIATRKNSDAGRTRSSYRHSVPPSPCLSRQASFESNASRVLSMPPLRVESAAAPRAVTPVEGEYKTIGAFKLGSLRITNGDASPTPDVEEKRDGLASKDNLPTRHIDYFASTQKLSMGGTDVYGITDDRPQASPIASPKPLVTRPTPITTSFETSALTGKLSHHRTWSVTGSDQGEFTKELSLSPVAVENPVLAGLNLQTTSKHTAVEDDLFEEEVQPEYSSVEVLDIRVDPSAKADVGVLSNSTTDTSLRSFSRSDSGFVPSPTSDVSHKPLSKADSGYSSNVSLRSLRASSKPPVPEKDLASPISERSIMSPQAESFYIGELQLPSPTIKAAEFSVIAPAAPEREAPPPPPPPKDFVPTSPVPRSSSSMSSTRGTTSAGIRPPTSPTDIRRKPVPSPINSQFSRDGGMRSPELLSPISVKSDTSASALSIGSGSHKPSKLQRLLSFSGNHSRGPPTVHTTHIEEKADVPSVPHHVTEKLQEHTGLFPLSSKRLTLRNQLSRETLRTIFSVGSLELPSVELQRAVTPTPDDNQSGLADAKGAGRRHGFPGVSSSLANVLRKPIARKPVPVRKDAEVRKKASKEEVTPEPILEVEAELTTYRSVNNSLGNNPYDAAFMAMSHERDAYASPAGRTMSMTASRDAYELPGGRTMSMTASLERTLDMRMAATKSRSEPSDSALLSPGFNSTFADIPPIKKARTPPPVTMHTQRTPKALRVPPPLRPQSTPPVPSRSMSRPSSNDSIRSYLSYQSLLTDEDTSKSPPAIPPMNPRRSMTFQDPRQPQDYRQASWDQQASRDASRVQFDHGRTGSMTSHHSRQTSSVSQGVLSPDFEPPRQRQVPPHYVPTPRAAPQLRHRASHDGFSNVKRQSWAGYSQPINGHMYPSYDAGQQSMKGQGFQKWAPPPYVPRGHYRNRSLGNRQVYPGQPPYRILHSYNSPAYRGVPIWG